MASDRTAFIRATVLFIFFLAIHRAGSLTVGSVRSGDPEAPLPLGTVVALRLGNTRSCVAGFRNDGVLFQRCIPSWVAISDGDDGVLLVGEAAKNHAAHDPRAAVFGFKRLLGKRFDHIDVQMAAENVPYKIVNKDTRTGIQVVKTTKDGSPAKQFHVEEVAAMVFAELKAQAEAHLGRKVRSAVVTVPYYFGDASRRAAMDAAALAGLETVRIIDEPIAAAVSRGLHKKLPVAGMSTVLVLHLGGGTADATVLAYEDGVFEAIGSWHDLHLGGDDFDRRITDHFTELIRENHGGADITGNDTAALGRLRAECERAKNDLSDHDVTHVKVESLSLSETLTRAKFEELTDGLLRRVALLVEKAMAGSGVAEVDEIVLVGGSSRIPRIQKMVGNYFGSRGIGSTAAVEEHHEEEAVVHGGALLGHPTAGGYHCMGGDRRQLGSSSDWCFHYD